MLWFFVGLHSHPVQTYNLIHVLASVILLGWLELLLLCICFAFVCICFIDIGQQQMCAFIQVAFCLTEYLFFVWQGRLSFYVTSFGEEATTVATAAALDPKDVVSAGRLHSIQVATEVIIWPNCWQYLDFNKGSTEVRRATCLF